MTEKVERSRDSTYGGAAAIAPKKLTIPDVVTMKRDGKRITMMTAYDAAFARLVDAAGIDILLVGDSAGMVVLGHPNTVPVTMDDMVRMAAAVSRGASRPVLVGDMPFGSYQTGTQDALRNAARFLKEAGMDAVKIEGGHETVDTVRALVENGISVMAHVGLTPQSVYGLGGYRVQGRGEAAAKVLDQAHSLEKAGAFSIVLEAMPADLGAEIAKELQIPTIGIGAGSGTDAQVLVINDLLGLNETVPKFAKRYVDLRQTITTAVEGFVADVEAGTFPDEEHVYS